MGNRRTKGLQQRLNKIEEDIFAGEDIDIKEFYLLKKELITALKNGNINKQKYNIVFHSTNGVLKIYSTIWIVGEKYIGVKGNLVIPISSILDIKI